MIYAEVVVWTRIDRLKANNKNTCVIFMSLVHGEWSFSLAFAKAYVQTMYYTSCAYVKIHADQYHHRGSVVVVWYINLTSAS